MKRIVWFALLAAFVVLVGCAPKSSDNAASSGSTTPATTTPAATDTAKAQLLAKSLYDDGARASEGAVDAAAAAAGEKLFATKGCTACHAYGKKLQGPDLKGVTTRRTQAWMEHQIMQPDVMTKTDPISHQLMVDNKNLQMLNLHLTQAEADQIIQYFKKLDAAK